MIGDVSSSGYYQGYHKRDWIMTSHWPHPWLRFHLFQYNYAWVLRWGAMGTDCVAIRSLEPGPDQIIPFVGS